ncbi:MAG: DUF4340 domain-containing protein [Phycisphaerae bacterium]|nr:DUF4340 domain-containing protein [Phycisphaerae bacterium]
MNNTKLTILGIMAVLAVLAAVSVNRMGDTTQAAAAADSPLIQGLDPSQIAAITIGTGDNTVTLKRSGSRFVVTNKDNYPADTAQINDLITKILDIRTVEKITDNPENFADLGVADAGVQNKVVFEDAKADALTGVIVGKRTDSGGSYVKDVKSNDVYVSKESPWLRTSAMDYIDAQLVNVNKDDILSVAVTDPNGSYTLYTEPNSSNVYLKDMPEGKKLKNEQDVFSALSGLRFNDVMRQASADASLKFNYKYVCNLKNETVYTFQIAKKDSKYFAKVSAKYTGETNISKERKVESEEELKKKEQQLLARDAAEGFNKNHDGWVYEIADRKAKNLTKPLSGLLEDITPLKEENEDADKQAEIEGGQDA